jgi:hypothetical protein
MMRLLGIDRIRAHSCRYSMLPEVTVPSAAVTDADTAAWSRESYARDMEGDKPKRTDEVAR